jgi:hypothetical protein
MHRTSAAELVMMFLPARARQADRSSDNLHQVEERDVFQVSSDLVSATHPARASKYTASMQSLQDVHELRDGKLVLLGDLPRRPYPRRLRREVPEADHCVIDVFT